MEKKRVCNYKFSSSHLLPLYAAGEQAVTFSQVVTEVMRQLEGAYALIFKSPHYPNELIACKRGSTLILGVKVSLNDIMKWPKKEFLY